MGAPRSSVSDDGRRRSSIHQAEANELSGKPTAGVVTSTLRVTAPSFHPTRKLISSCKNVTSNAPTTTTTTDGSVMKKSPSPASSTLATSSTATPPPPFQSSHMALPPPRWLLHMPARSEVPTSSSQIPQFTLSDLGQEIRAFNSYNALTAEEHAAREHILGVVQQCVSSLWGNDARAFVFGSYALDLSLPESDVDIAVLFPKRLLKEEEEAHVSPEVVQQRRMDALHELAAAIHAADPGDDTLDTQEGPRYAIEVIDQCRVPVIQLRDVWTQVRCDICVTRPQMDVVVEKQKAWLAKNPVARDLILTTKAALKQWGLNQAFTGGLSSTCVYSLVHRFLREEPIPVPPAVCNNGVPSTGHESVSSSGISSRCQSPGGLSSPTSSSTHEFEEITCKEVSCDASRMVSPVPEKATLLGPSTAMMAGASESRLVDAEVMPPTADIVGKQLLMFWGYLTHDLFSSGYFLSDAFRPDDGVAADAAQLSVAVGEGAFDISKCAFRLGEAQLLFRHSIDVLVQLLGSRAAALPGVGSTSSFGGFMGSAAAVSVVTGSRVPSLLFPILVDPRQQTGGDVLNLPPPPPPHVNRQRRRQHR